MIRAELTSSSNRLAGPVGDRSRRAVDKSKACGQRSLELSVPASLEERGGSLGRIHLTVDIERSRGGKPLRCLR